MSPRERYALAVQRSGFAADPAQAAAVEELQRVFDALIARKPLRERLGRLARRMGIARFTPEPVRGLYLWGSVGRGKTWLMDQFFDCLPFHDKRRRHFHRFMQAVHHDLARLEDQADPLEAVAARIAAETSVICFDEFHVSDIADAMLLGNLFEGLFRRGVTLVATSNLPPDSLYKDGLQRQRFLPAIAAIKANTTTLQLGGTEDYRLRVLEKAEIYHAPLDELADAGLEDAFERIAPEPGKRDHALEIEGRAIPARRRADGVVWFEFADLCGGPRGPADYIEIARCFQTVLVSNIPLLDASRDNEARRFITMVDEFYDRNVKLIVSAAAQAAGLYQGERLGFEYRRTLSRLEEMQSRAYLARPHLP